MASQSFVNFFINLKIWELNGVKWYLDIVRINN